MQFVEALKKKTQNSLMLLFGYFITIVILVIGLFYFMTGFHLIVLLIGIPYLIGLCVGGFPLGYYKLTGKPYEYSLGDRKELEKDKSYFVVTDIGQTSGKQLLSQCVLLLVVMTLVFHWYSTVAKPLLSAAIDLLKKLF